MHCERANVAKGLAAAFDGDGTKLFCESPAGCCEPVELIGLNGDVAGWTVAPGLADWSTASSVRVWNSKIAS